MAATYRQFLASPSSSLLSPNAGLHYITTTTSFRGPTDIIKHFTTLRNQIKKTREDIIEVIEGRDAIAVQVNATYTFITSGGPYLPGLDDNFLSDREVHLLIMHIVTFDDQGRIVQIRQNWDQGSLLKQVDVIGKSGRNWPIRDSSEQIRVTTSCLKDSAEATAVSSSEPSDLNRSRGNSNALRDPHASLELFTSREDADRSAPARVVSPYAGTRPRERSFTEILGDEPEGDDAYGRDPSESPSKVVAPKGGAGKNFRPSRLFEAHEEEDDDRGRSQHQSSRPIAPKAGSSKNFQPNRLFDSEEPEQESPAEKPRDDRFYRPNPKRYQHFNLADGPDAEATPKAAPPADRSRSRSKHDSSWSFDDFVTPQKTLPTRGVRKQEVRHWDAEPGAFPETPSQNKPAMKPRRDAEHHFDFVDDGPEASDPRPAGLPRGTKHNTGLGLYENHLYNEDGSAPTPGPDPRALGNITNLKDRKKDFAAHFAMTDEPESDVTPQQKKISDDRKKAVKMMEANWAATDTSPAPYKENDDTFGVPGRKAGNGGISIAGDGMGSRKVVGPNGGSSRGAHGGIHIAGDGMGGKKGANRDWLFHDDE